MSLLDDFKTRFPPPAFPTAIADQWVPIYADVWQCYYGKPYSGCTKEIILNLIAHLIFMETRPTANSVREKTSRTVGSVSVSSAAATTTGDMQDFFGTSKYGQRFMMLTMARGAYFV